MHDRVRRNPLTWHHPGNRARVPVALKTSLLQATKALPKVAEQFMLSQLFTQRIALLVCYFGTQNPRRGTGYHWAAKCPGQPPRLDPKETPPFSTLTLANAGKRPVTEILDLGFSVGASETSVKPPTPQTLLIQPGILAAFGASGPSSA